jgi:RNA polymerase sigma-70 factor (sigma-E family)
VTLNPTRPGHDVDELYREHALAMVRLALLLTGDQATAEDVVQDAFLGLYRGWSRLRDPDAAVGYLRRAVVNGCRSVHRSRRRLWPHAQLDHDPPPVWSAEAAAIDSEERRTVLAAVARLPRRQREILALRYYLDLPDSEVAAILKISRGTVSSTVSRAVATLARQLQEQQ